MKLSILSGKIAWFGKHSGYEPLTDYLPENIDMDIIRNGDGLFGKIVGKFFQIYYKWKLVKPQDIFSELKFISNINDKTVSHILYLEGHLQIIDKIKKGKKKLLGTIHLPISQWKDIWYKQLSGFEHAIILYKEEIPLFGKYIAPEKIKFIRLGISIDFFKPNTQELINNK